MGYKYQGDVIINAALTVNTPKPLDTRTVVEDLNALYDISENTAYQGMTVANINDGNLYMLIDKNKIHEKSGWKASYESIQIITCTQAEYDTWASNTTEDYKPIDESLTYLRKDVYYYIYEDEDNSQYYVTKKQIEDWLSAKAAAGDLKSLSAAFDTHVDNYETTIEQLSTSVENILTNYSTSEQIAEIYATKDSLQSTDSKFENYYTSEEINKTLEEYVTKESLRGGLEGEDDFVFVTQTQYNTDKEAEAKANAVSITTQSLIIKKEEVENTVTVTNDDLSVNNKPLAYREEVPKIQLVETKAEYEEMEKDPDTYYYVCDDETVGYLTNVSASDQFFTKVQVNTLIAQAKQDLIDNYIVPLQQEIAALKGQTL